MQRGTVTRKMGPPHHASETLSVHLTICNWSNGTVQNLSRHARNCADKALSIPSGRCRNQPSLTSPGML
jgi:hypothetical protein